MEPESVPVPPAAPSQPPPPQPAPPAPTAVLPPPPAGPPQKIGPLALTALIVGGAAFLFGLVPYFGLLLAVTAIVFAIMAIVKKQTPRWMPLVGGGAAVLALITGLIVTSVVANGIRTPIAAPIVTSAPQTQAESEETDEPVVEETVEPAPVEPELTLGQDQAIQKAESYLDFTSFSRSGLIGQLEYEGFVTADATFAVDYLTVDWNEQAAKKAQEYLDFSSFSRQGLIDQLVYEGFSQAEAEYGATAVGY